jgi:flagellar biosynthesis/type III secretory pathway M-ring protein FliF/YscJ
MSVNMALYIFLPMILLALIIVIILLVRKNRADSQKKSLQEENNRETENQENDEPTMHNGVYTDLNQLREPDNTYTSLNLYENLDDNSSESYYTTANTNHPTTPRTFGTPRRSSYVIPPPIDEYETPNNT